MLSILVGNLPLSGGVPVPTVINLQNVGASALRLCLTQDGCRFTWGGSIQWNSFPSNPGNRRGTMLFFTASVTEGLVQESATCSGEYRPHLPTIFLGLL